jgi:hydrogenase-4 component F
MLLALLLVPISAGAYCALARSRRSMEAANLAAFAVTFALALAVAAETLSAGSVSMWNGFLHADALSALAGLLTSGVALVCAANAVGYLRADEAAGALGEDDAAVLEQYRKYYALTPLLVGSMLLVTTANNLGVMWVAIEATTLTSVFLVMFYGKNTSLEAAWKYAIIGGVGLSMALFGTVLVYYAGRNIAGSDTLAGLNWSVLAAHARQLDPAAMRLAFILALLGYGTKAGLAPMHTWKPDAYCEAPVPSAAILSTALLNCALYGLIRFYVLTCHSVGAEFPGRLLIIMGLFSMAVAAPFMLLQKNFRRFLAYSTIDQAGIMALALGLGSRLAALALMLHMTYHAIAKSLLFLGAGGIYQRFRTDLFARVRGAIHVAPVAAVTFLAAVLAICGMPPFSLFQSEFLMLRGAIEAGRWAPALLFTLFSSAIFAGALLQAGGLVLGAPGDPPVAGRDRWREGSTLALAAALAITSVWLPGPLLALIRGAARVVVGG